MRENTTRNVSQYASAPFMRVSTCGEFTLERLVLSEDEEGQPPRYEPIARNEWKGRRTAQTLLKILLCSPDRRASKEAIIEAIWPGEQTTGRESARALQVADSTLRTLLSLPDGSSLLMTTDGTDGAGYRLANQQRLWVDVDAFEAAILQASKAKEREQALVCWETAYQWTHGVFLPDDVFSEWSQVRRRRIEGNRRLCVHRLAALYMEQKRVDEAEVVLRTCWAENPTDEDMLRRLMHLLAQQGRDEEALLLYEQTQQALEEDSVSPTSRTTELAASIRRKSYEQELYSSLISPNSLNASSVVRSEILSPTLSPLSVSQKSLPIVAQNRMNLSEIHAEQVFGELLAVGAFELGAFFDKGWSVDIIVDTLRVLLPIIKVVSPFIEHRQHVTSLTSRESLSSLSTKIASTEEEQIRLCQAFHESIGEGWKFFTMARNSQALAISQAQLMLLQQVHAVLPVDEVPLLYSSIYNFMGMALCQQGHYAQALQSHKNAYLAALSTGKALEIIYGLLCQSNSYYGLNSYDTTIEVLKQALRILDNLHDIRYAHTKAHTLGIWADAAMMSGDYKTARKKLDASASLLNDIKPNEEFDKSSWYQLLGKYSYLTGDFPAAARCYEQALSELPLEWTMRRALVIMSLISTYTVIQDRDASLVTVEKAIQLLPTLNAPFINSTLFTALQGLTIVFPYEAKIKTTIPELLQLVS